jgi:hypothetical protein
MSSGSFSQRNSPAFLEDDALSQSAQSQPVPPAATSSRTQLPSATIPPVFLAENPWDPYHNVMDTRDAVYGWGAGGERPGAPDPNYKRYHWIDDSGNNTSGHWESMTKVGFQRHQNRREKEEKAKQEQKKKNAERMREAHRERTLQKRKENSKKAEQRRRDALPSSVPNSSQRKASSALSSDGSESSGMNEDSLSYAGDVNLDIDPPLDVSVSHTLDEEQDEEEEEDFSVDVTDLVLQHPPIGKVFSNVRPSTAADVEAKISTPYRHVVPSFIANLQPNAPPPRSKKTPLSPYPYPWPGIRLSGDLKHPELQLNTETWEIKKRDKVFKKFFDISKEQARLRDEAQKKGNSSWRWTGRDKIVEVFFDIDLNTLQEPDHPTSMAQALEDANDFEELPADKSYIAYDKNLKVIVVFYADAFYRAWGPKSGEFIIQTTAENIDKVARFVKPVSKMDDRRHSQHEEWVAEQANQNFTWATGPDARSTIYYSGLSVEQGHPHNKAVIAKDWIGKTSYGGSLMRDLYVWCGNITKTLDSCFAGVDLELRNAYRRAYSTLGQTGDRRASETCTDELFQFRALLVNVLTEPHVDQDDWKGGMAWLTPFGDYRDGHFCVTMLRKKIPFQPGPAIGIRGDKVEHFTTKWRGSNRYCWVFTFHEKVRRRGW